MKYVLLLRGINVGGNHRVPKAELKLVLESLGLLDVTIYINSGNAVFSSEGLPREGTMRSALEKHFGFSIPTLLLSAEKVRAIAAAIPSTWTNDTPNKQGSGQKSDVLYLFDEVNSVNILKEIGYKPELETMIYVDGAVLVNISRANQSRGGIQKLIGSKLYQQITIRNINTAKKLAELVSD